MTNEWQVRRICSAIWSTDVREGVLQHLERDGIERVEAGLVLIAQPPSRADRMFSHASTSASPPGGTTWWSRAGRSIAGPSNANAGRQVVAQVDRRVEPAPPLEVTSRSACERAAGVCGDRLVPGELGLRRHADRLAVRAVDLDRRRRRGGSCTRARARRGTSRRPGHGSMPAPRRAPTASATGRGSACRSSRCEAHLLVGHALGCEPLARLVLELAELRLDLGRVDRVGAGAGYIVDMSWRMSTSRQPSAEVMPGLGGTITVGIDSSRASAGAVQRAGAAERRPARSRAGRSRGGSRSGGRRRPCWRSRPSARPWPPPRRQPSGSADALGMRARRPARRRACISPPTSSGARRPSTHVRVGVRGLRAAAAVARRARARHRPTAGRCAASRPRRSTPASRRRRRS